MQSLTNGHWPLHFKSYIFDTIKPTWAVKWNISFTQINFRKKMLLQFDWILNYWSPNCTYRREGRHLEVPAPEWVYFINFQSDSVFFLKFSVVWDFLFTRVIEISFPGWLRGDNTKWKFGNRESRRGRRKNERRGFYLDIHHTSIFPFFQLWHFWLNFYIKTIFPLWEQEREGKEREERFLSIILQICNFFQREREKVSKNSFL